ncbi:tetratricopeptide repeat protein [Daejeonella oryzae]|uniref:tetratricopeptide repeat protein n=1 Tax=Daejeonella oryzae TaxID=1122943 RepID=UPI0006854979|nr:adenylate/guanylate cyclase domain-containing protein [Daejeonella oryzae]
MQQSRQLAAIMFTDIVGYTALMGNDEQKAFELLKKNRDIQKPIIEQFNGRWIKELGDGILASFNTVTDAVHAAIKIQEICKQTNDFLLRIGIHQGEVVFENEDVFGDAVNIASRIQAIAMPGGIYISESVRNNVFNKQNIATQFVEQEILKNVKEPVRIYKVITDSEISNSKEQLKSGPGKSIAVLPFVNMSNDPGQEYFSDGMAEEILNSLSHLKDLKVAGRTSSFQFKGKNMDLREVGEKLGVSTVLEGSIRRQGNRLRIITQLINVEDGFHIWSERYDREMEDIFAIQDEIAFAITEKLKVTLLENDRELITKTHTQNTEAYHLYLQGRYFWNRRNEEGLKAASRFFEKALQKDPDYALAWAGLADTYSLMGEYTNISRRELFPKQMDAVNRALKIDPNLGEAHISMATSLMLNDWDWENSEKEFKIGIKMSPNYATGHHWYAEWLLFTGNFNEAIREISIAVELDPVSQGILKDKGICYYYNRQYDEAIDIAMQTIDLDPDFAPVHRLLSLSYQAKGLFEKAISENECWGELTGNKVKTDVALASIYAAAGKKEEARKIIQNLTDVDLSGNDYRGMAVVYAALAESEKAFEWLEKSWEMHEESLCSLKVDPKFDALRNDPRFDVLLKKIGL